MRDERPHLGFQNDDRFWKGGSPGEHTLRAIAGRVPPTDNGPTVSLLQNHDFSYNEPMPVESCTQAICDLALRFGESDEESVMVGCCRQPDLDTILICTLLPLLRRADLSV